MIQRSTPGSWAGRGCSPSCWDQEGQRQRANARFILAWTLFYHSLSGKKRGREKVYNLFDWLGPAGWRFRFLLPRFPEGGRRGFFPRDCRRQTICCLTCGQTGGAACASRFRWPGRLRLISKPVGAALRICQRRSPALGFAAMLCCQFDSSGFTGPPAVSKNSTIPGVPSGYATSSRSSFR